MEVEPIKHTAVVFGATGGIGRVLSKRLATAGWQLILSARSESAIVELADELGTFGVSADAGDLASVESVFQQAKERFGGVDGVVNCCGSLLLKAAHHTSGAEWADVLHQNLTTSFHILRTAVTHMMKEGGSIVLMSSAVAQRGMINHEAIAAAKAGVAGLALSAAATYARHRIRVNCVSPGLTRTPLTQSLTRNEAAERASTALHPLQRLGEPHEVASAIQWFLDPEQSWVTGQILAVDGGLSSVQPRPVAHV